MNKLLILLFFITNISLSAQLRITAQQWQEDLLFLKETVNNDYPFLFKKITAEKWNKKVDELYHKIPNLAEHQIAAGMAEIVAAFEYGHTVLSLDDRLGFHRLPINLYAFNDGVFIQGVSRDYEDLVGAQLLKIENTEIDEAIKMIKSIVPVENDQFHKAYGLNYLRIPEALHATGVIPALSNQVSLTLRKNGHTFTKTMRGIKNLSIPTTYGYVVSDSAWVSARNEAETPYYLKNLDRNYYYELLPEHNTVYVRQSRVRDEEDQSIKDFYGEVFQFIREKNVEKLIIDVRLNGGGNNYKNKAVITGLIENKEINQIGNLMVILGRRTFSACQNLVNEMSNYTNAVFVGEPTAENINFYGDNRPVELPNSKLNAYLSFAWWQDKPQWENGPWLAPHLAVDMDFQQYVNNEDPVMHAALNFDGEEFVLNPMEYMTDLFTTGQIDKLQSEAVRMVQDPRYGFFDFEGSFNNAGENLLKSKRGMEAIFVFNMTLQLFPESALTYLNMGKAQAFLGQKEQAKSSFQKALELDPEGEIGEISKKSMLEMQ